MKITFNKKQLNKEVYSCLRMSNFIIKNILTDSQLDEKLPCGVFIRNFTLRLNTVISKIDKLNKK
jgi:hypothetical protein